MANPRPSIVASDEEYDEDIFIELIPITCPLSFTRGPPEFPEFIAASV